MVDLTELTAGVAVFKSGMDGLKLALDIVRGVRGELPDKAKEQLSLALDQSEQALKIAESQIALGLGFALCHCGYPGTPMLTIGKRRVQGVHIRLADWIPVHRCPKCLLDDAPPGSAITYSASST